MISIGDNRSTPITERGIYLRHLHIVVWGLSSIITGLPLPLVADTLDEVLMEVTDVEMSHLQTIQGALKKEQVQNTLHDTCVSDQSSAH